MTRSFGGIDKNGWKSIESLFIFQNYNNNKNRFDFHMIKIYLYQNKIYSMGKYMNVLALEKTTCKL